MEKMLLLLLGIAINGEFKEKFIEQIQQQLETHTQINLIPYIQLVTEDINFSVSKSILFKLDNLATCSAPSTSHNSPIVILPPTVKTTLTLEINGNPAESHTPTTTTMLTTSTSLEPILENETNISLQSNVSTSSSTTSFTNNCQQLAASTNNSNNSNSANSALVLSYSNLDQLNYFLNNKIMQNVQRIVDERDSYLESIIELQQDKDYLSFKLNSSLQMHSNTNNSGSNGGLNEATLHIKQLNSLPNLNSPNANGIANNLANSISNNCNLGDAISSENKNAANSNLNEASLNLTSSSSLIELSDPQTLLVLIESIYKEIASANTIIESTANMKNVNENLLNNLIDSSSMNNHHQADFNADVNVNGLSDRLNAINLENTANSSLLLNDLKNRKLLANNWNQKIAIELVECKVKLRQLINEM